jgi:hypothetical protein
LGQRHSRWRNSRCSGWLGRGSGGGGGRRDVSMRSIYLIHMERNSLHNKKNKICERNMLNIYIWKKN